jgi:hypothetical protein
MARFCPRVPPWAASVFLVAFLLRIGFVLVVDQPLLYAHQYTYFTGAMRIAEHPTPLSYVLTSDEWRTWDQHWTIAPLYHLFAAAVFKCFGPHLLPLRVIQCVLDSLVAVIVALLGRRVAGPRGYLAGIVYAVYFPAIEMPSWTMTENLHTVLLLAGVALLASEATTWPKLRTFGSGLLLGLSALARSVSTGLIALAALRKLLRSGVRKGLVPAALVAAGGAAVILPWTARNVFVIGDNVLIESAAFENIWWANHFVERERFLRQQAVVHGRPTPAAKRMAALQFALKGIGRRPERFVEKIGSNFRHFLRPEGLQNVLVIERSLETWRHVATLLMEDVVLLATLPFFLIFVFAGRPSATRQCILMWVGYYLFMVIVVFHNEIRYRSAFVPFLFAGAAGGLAALAERRRQWRILASLALGLVLVGWILRPFVGRAGPTIAAALASERANEKDPGSPRPWFNYGRHLIARGEVAVALDAYDRGALLATAANWRALVVRPRLLHELGRDDEAVRALRRLHRHSWDTDPWLVLEIAWRELPPPRTDTIVVGGGDYGAVRGFLHPRGGDPGLSAHRLEWTKYGELGGPQPAPGLHRWSRRRAWLRLLPPQPASVYDVTLIMGSPFPSLLESVTVTVRVSGGESHRFVLDRELRPYTFRASCRPGEPVVVRLDAPTWSRMGEPADQGVRVDRMSVSPASASP